MNQECHGGQEAGACRIQAVNRRRSRTEARAPVNNTTARITLSAGTTYMAWSRPCARKVSLTAGEPAAAAAREASRAERSPVPTGPSEAPMTYIAQK